MLGTSLGGLLVDHFGWVSIFLMNLPPLLLSVLLSSGFFKDDLQVKPRSDFKYVRAGTLLTACGPVWLLLGLKNLPWLLAPALVSLALFIWWERTTALPLPDMKLISNRSFAAGRAKVGLQNLGMYALLFQ